MTLRLRDLANNPNLLDTPENEQIHCHNCNVVLQETITGKKPTPKGFACADCYYDLLGALIEESPIASGGNRRG